MRNIDRRFIVAGLLLAVLAGLLYWQHRREGLVADCLEAAGRWDGPTSKCRLPDNRILMRPGLGRG